MTLNCLYFFYKIVSTHILPAQPQVVCVVYRKEDKMSSYITPVDVVRRSDGTLYVITADELAIIRALGVSRKEYAKML